MNGSLRYASYILLALLLGFWIRAGYIWWYPYEPLVVHAINILDADNVVTAGETVYYETAYTKKMAVVATISRWLMNSYVIPIPAYTGQVPLGDGKSINPVLIPDFASTGTYRLAIEYAYDIGSYPTRTIKVQAQSGPFLIVKRENIEVRKNTEDIREMKDKVERDEKVMKRHRKLSIYDKAK